MHVVLRSAIKENMHANLHEDGVILVELLET